MDIDNLIHIDMSDTETQDEIVRFLKELAEARWEHFKNVCKRGEIGDSEVGAARRDAIDAGTMYSFAVKLRNKMEVNDG